METDCKNGEYHDFEAIDINMWINLKIKKAQIGQETTCQDCGLEINVYGGLDIEIKGDDY